MNNNKHIIDDFFSSKAEELHVTFNEDHWKKAAQRLDEQEKKRKPFLLPILGLLGFVLMASGLYLYQHTGESKYNKTSAEKVSRLETYQAVNSTANSSMPYQDTATKIEMPENNLITPAENSTATHVKEMNTISDDQNIQTSNIKTPSTTSSSPIQKTYSAVKHDVIIKKIKHALAKQEIMSSSPTTSATTNHKSITNSDIEQTISSKQSKEEKTNTSPTSDNITYFVPKNNPEKFEEYNPRYLKSALHYTETKTDKVVLASLVTLNKLDIEKEVVETIKQQNIDTSTLSTPKIKKWNTIATVQTGTTKTLSANNFRAPINTIAASSKLNASLYGGVGYQYVLNNKFSISTLLSFTFYKGINTEIRVQKTKYRYGKLIEEFILRPSTQFQFQVPIMLNYAFKPKHQFSVGLGLSYGIGLSGEVKEFEETTFKKTFGYNNGYHNEDVFAQCQYVYHLTSSTGLLFMYQQGLRDMSINGFFSNTNIDRLARFNVGVQYKFNHKK